MSGFSEFVLVVAIEEVYTVHAWTGSGPRAKVVGPNRGAHTNGLNEVTLVWDSLRLATIINRRGPSTDP